MDGYAALCTYDSYGPTISFPFVLLALIVIFIFCHIGFDPGLCTEIYFIKQVTTNNGHTFFRTFSKLILISETHLTQRPTLLNQISKLVAVNGI